MLMRFFTKITTIGQHPRKYSDTYIMLEQVGHRLDREVERLYRECEDEGLQGMEITHQIEEKIDLSNVLKTSTKEWDGDMWYAVSHRKWRSICGQGSLGVYVRPFGIWMMKLQY